MIIMNVRISIITWITNSENKNNSKKKRKENNYLWNLVTSCYFITEYFCDYHNTSTFRNKKEIVAFRRHVLNNYEEAAWGLSRHKQHFNVCVCAEIMLPLFIIKIFV